MFKESFLKENKKYIYKTTQQSLEVVLISPVSQMNTFIPFSTGFPVYITQKE